MDLLSPAKINLYLEVVGKRSDGYHDLLTLMCPVTLYDRIHLAVGGDAIKVRCRHPGVPEGADNLAGRAAALFTAEYRMQTGRNLSGVDITIEKRIPVGGGLGGGSSNAATVLSSLNRYCGQPFSPSRLSRMAATLGADIPFFLLGRPAVATGIGDLLKVYEGLRPMPLLLVNPGFEISTAEVYGKLNLALTKCKKKNKNLNFEKRDFDVTQDLCNDLEQVASEWYPEVISIKVELLRLGALSALMSGSGPSVFGLFSDADKANQAEVVLRTRFRWQVIRAALAV